VIASGRVTQKGRRLAKSVYLCKETPTVMQQINRSIYVVTQGEVVTVAIVATMVGEFASLVIDGAPQVPVGSGPLTYAWTVTVGPGGTHFGVVTCAFPKAAPDDAHYQLRLSANGPGGPSGPFEGSDIYKTDPIWSRPIEFRNL
jgi:hypothetical protein